MNYPKKISTLAIFFLFSVNLIAREKPAFSIKNLAKEPVENRLNYLFAIEYSWQKEPHRYKSIDSLKQIAKVLNDEVLASYSELFRHEYNIYLAKNPVEKGKYFEDAEKFSDESNNPELKAHLYYAIGIYDFYLKKTKTGLPLVFEAKKMLEKINYTNFRHAGYYYLGFFDFYFYYDDLKNAIKYQQLALNSKYNLFYSPASYYNNIALCYIRLKDYDNALAYLQKAMVSAQKMDDKNIEALVEGNFGMVYANKKQFKKALPYFYKDFEINKNELPENSLYTRYHIAECLLQLDSVKKAETYIFGNEIKMPIWEYPGYSSQKFKLMALYFQKNKNFIKANQYKDSVIALKDSLKIKYDFKKLKDFENLLEAEKNIAKNAELKLESQRQIVLRNSILGVLSAIFLVSISWLLYRRKKEKQIETQKQKLADEQIANANQQLDLFLNNIKEKNELIEKMTLELNQSNEQNPHLAEQTQIYLEKLQKSVILTDENWQDFKSIFEKLHPHFFSSLLQNYPEISPAETRLFALQKLKLPTKEMANMLGISTDSIKKARYRFRKKYPELLNEKNQEDLDDEIEETI